MRSLKRAFNAIFQRPFKTMILFITILILSTFLTISCFISTATTQIEKSIKDQMGAEIAIYTDVENSNMTHYPFEIKKQKQYIKNLIYYLNSLERHENIKNYDYTWWISGETIHPSIYNHETLDEKNKRIPLSSYEYLGITNLSSYHYVKNTIEIVSGRWFSKEEIEQGLPVAVLFSNQNKHLQNHQTVNVDDIINITIPRNDLAHSMEVLELKVIGLYHKGTSINEDWCKVNYCMDSVIMMPGKIMEESFFNSLEISNLYNVGITDVNLKLDSIEAIEGIKENVEEEGYRVKTTNDNYLKISNIITATHKMSSRLSYITVLVTSLILGVMQMIFMAERKKEIGIYLAIGLKLKEIIFQILAELVIISTCAVMLAALFGNNIGDKITNIIIHAQEQEIRNTEEMTNSSYEYEYDSEDYLSIYFINLGVILASSIVTIYFISTIKPKDLLKNK